MFFRVLLYLHILFLGPPAMSTLPYVWLTCAFGHNRRGEAQLVCWCAFLESAWCPVWDPRRQPGAWGGRRRGVCRVYWLGCARGRVKPGSGARAGQTRIGKGPGQIRIGNTGGSNPKREKPHTKNKKIKNCGFNHTRRNRESLQLERWL